MWYLVLWGLILQLCQVCVILSFGYWEEFPQPVAKVSLLLPPVTLQTNSDQSGVFSGNLGVEKVLLIKKLGASN